MKRAGEFRPILAKNDSISVVTPFRSLLGSRVARNTVASYVSFVSVAVCGVLTIPAVVHYLTPEQIGLWSVAGAIVSYLLWMDLGVGEATGRMMAGAVASGDQTEINRWWTATRVVLIAQGVGMVLVGVLLAPTFLAFFDIPAGLREDAKLLYYGVVIVSGLSMPVRGVHGLFTAQHRAHWSYLGSAVSVWINLGVLVAMLRCGVGLRAYVIALAATQVALWLYYLLLIRLGEGCPKWDWGGVRLGRFRALFGFSVSLGVMGILDGLIRTMPAIVLARMGGLALVPVFDFTAKLPIMLTSLVNRTLWAFYPGLLRLQVTGKREEIAIRHRMIGGFILPLSSLFGSLVIAFNSVLVEILAGPGFYAGHLTNSIFAAALVVEPTTHLFRCLLHLSGSMGKALAVSLGNLALCVLLACAGYYGYGMPGLATACLIVPVVLGVYGLLHGGTKCGFRRGQLALGVIYQSGAVAVVFLLAGKLFDGTFGAEQGVRILGRSVAIPSSEILLAAGISVALSVVAMVRAFRSLSTLVPRQVAS